MHLSYCDRCGALVTDQNPKKSGKAEEALCEECQKGKERKRRRHRDSGCISQEKLDKAISLGRSKK